MSKLILRNLKRSLRRWQRLGLALVLCGTLGVGSLVGLLSIRGDLQQTTNYYYAKNNLYDLCLVSDIGIADADVYAVSQAANVESVMGVYSVDGLVTLDKQGLTGSNASALTGRVLSLDTAKAARFMDGENDVSYSNRLTLVQGEFPSQNNECVVELRGQDLPTSCKIGSVITLQGDRTDPGASLSSTQFTVTGFVRSPEYLTLAHGTTQAGGGRLDLVFYAPTGAFNMAQYTHLYIKLLDSERLATTSDTYAQQVAALKNTVQALAEDRINLRASALKAEYAEREKAAKASLAQQETNVGTRLQAAKDKVQQTRDLVQSGDAQLERLQMEFENSLSAAQKSLYGEQNEYNADRANYLEKLEAYTKAKQAADANPNAQANYNKAAQEMSAAQTALTKATQAVETLSGKVKVIETAINSTSNLEPWSAIVERYKQAGLKTDSMVDAHPATQIGLASQAVAFATAQLDEIKTQLTQAKSTEETAKKTVEQKQAAFEKSKEGIETLQAVQKAKQALDAANAALMNSRDGLAAGDASLTSQQTQMQLEISELGQKIEQAKKDIDDIDNMYLREEAAIYEQIDQVRYELEAAQRMLAVLPQAQWHITTRLELTGVQQVTRLYNNLLGWAVAVGVLVLLMLTLAGYAVLHSIYRHDRQLLQQLSMQGMPPAQATRPYRALLLCWHLIGAVFGIVLGTLLMPYLLGPVLTASFTLPALDIRISLPAMLCGLLVAVFAAIAAWLLAQKFARKEEKPVETVSHLAGGLPLHWKAALRTLASAPKRGLCILLGVTLSVGVLFASLSLFSGADALRTKQYGGITRYAISLVLKEAQANADEGTVQAWVAENKNVAATLLVQAQAMYAAGNGETTILADVYVPQDAGQLGTMVKLGASLEGGAVVSKQLAGQLGLRKGSTLTLQNGGKTAQVTVGGITKQYAAACVYLSADAYEAAFGSAPQYKTLWVKAADGTSYETLTELENTYAQHTGIYAASITSAAAAHYRGTQTGLYLLAAAGTLAGVLLLYIVLSVLLRSNLRMRQKEISAIKLLGLPDKKITRLFGREYLLYILAGSLLGAGLGIALYALLHSTVYAGPITLGDCISLLGAGAGIVLTALVTLLILWRLREWLRKVKMAQNL